MSHYKIPAFTFIELLFTLSIVLLSFSLLPTLIHLTSHYLNLAQDNDDIEFEFFSRDILKEAQQYNNHISIEDSSKLIIRGKEEEIIYIFNHNKIYKNINHKGNITLLNNVVSSKIIKTNNKTIKIELKIGDTNNTKVKTIIL
ncbi:competence type IV pilus minor pilin ComGF [Staphylococcus caprae]|uniref:competence type IV pilus minor pilin ComGF n=1 Tax=Staphylococcus caprae TaxID=29380 RepID=UPI00254F721D|nr:competence type IV pilus minor pilin ComGF [Staphylococcus caprae]MDK6297505.1 competence type IV pilus minor pilin ComGF [Staphylococcus caprae]MDK7232652.1 competence type IV pilus minor pilin ComGF [Staphylococcus caprae]